MRILIVEDDQIKESRLVDFIEENIKNYCITIRHSYQSGLKEILNSKFDIILLDMSMSNFDITMTEDGGRRRPFAGKEIIRQMKRREITTPVIVVTQFESFGDVERNITLNQLKEDLYANFEIIYKGTVYYNAALENWKDDLRELMNKCF